MSGINTNEIITQQYLMNMYNNLNSNNKNNMDSVFQNGNVNVNVNANVNGNKNKNLYPNNNVSGNESDSESESMSESESDENEFKNITTNESNINNKNKNINKTKNKNTNIVISREDDNDDDNNGGKNGGRGNNVNEDVGDVDDEEEEEEEDNVPQMDQNELINFKENVKLWLMRKNAINNLQDNIKELQIPLRKIQDQIKLIKIKKKEMENDSNQLNENILYFMKKYQIGDLNTNSGKIKYSVVKRKDPINKKTVQDKIKNYFNNDEKSEELISIIYGKNRGYKEEAVLRMRMKKK